MKTKNPKAKEQPILTVIDSQSSSPQQINNQSESIESFISLWNKQAEQPRTKQERKRLQWNNLIHIDIEFYISGHLFKEEFLWDRARRDPKEIKQFAIELIRGNVIGDDFRLQKGLDSFSFECLDRKSLFDDINKLIDTAEYVCRLIIHEMRFYELFKPYEKITNGMFGSGKGGEEEHLIEIRLDIEGKYREDFTWDIMNNYNIPEDLAEEIVIENNLDRSFINKIAINIRKQIKDYVMCIFESLAISNCNRTIETRKTLPLNASSRKTKNKTKQTNLDNFVVKSNPIRLNSMLGYKRLRTNVSSNDNLPSFLQMIKGELSLPNYQTENIRELNKTTGKQITNEHIVGINEHIIIIKKTILNYPSLHFLGNIKPANSSNKIDNDDIKSKSSQSQSTLTNINKTSVKHYFDKKAKREPQSSESDFQIIL